MHVVINFVYAISGNTHTKIPWAQNTVNREDETLRTVNRQQCNSFFRWSNFKSETVSRAGQIVWHWRWL